MAGYLGQVGLHTTTFFMMKTTSRKYLPFRPPLLFANHSLSVRMVCSPFRLRCVMFTQGQRVRCQSLHLCTVSRFLLLTAQHYLLIHTSRCRYCLYQGQEPLRPTRWCRLLRFGNPNGFRSGGHRAGRIQTWIQTPSPQHGHSHVFLLIGCIPCFMLCHFALGAVTCHSLLVWSATTFFYPLYNIETRRTITKK